MTVSTGVLAKVVIPIVQIATLLTQMKNLAVLKMKMKVIQKNLRKGNCHWTHILNRPFVNHNKYSALTENAYN